MSFHALERSIPRLAYQLKIRRDHKGILRVRRRGDFAETGQFQRHFGSDQSVWRDGDWNGFVRIALAVLLAPLIELARGVGHLVPNCHVKVGD